MEARSHRNHADITVLRCNPPAKLVEQSSPEAQADCVELIAEVEGPQLLVDRMPPFRWYAEHVRVVEAAQNIIRHIVEAKPGIP
jgi:hypothetical protein